MITAVRGRLASLGPDWAEVELGPLTVRITVPSRELEGLSPGDAVLFHTQLEFRNDSLQLYGFASREGLRLFQMLTTVSGVGPRTAVSLLSALSPESLATAIASGDPSPLTSAQGVSRRLAGRIVLDLREKLAKEVDVAGAPEALPAQDGEVASALMALGYTSREARQAVESLPATARHLPLEERIRLALKALAG